MDMENRLMRFLAEDGGLTAVEYALAGGLITGAIVGIFAALGVTMTAVIDFINTALLASPAL